MPLRVRTPSSIARSIMTSPFAPKQGESLTLSSVVPLQDGHHQPRFGIGAWAMRGEEAYKSLLHAFEHGYRHVDTARYYRNEKEVGRAIRACNVPREQLYATTKLYLNDMGGGEKTRKAYEDSLQQSGLSYWDLVLLHAPDGGTSFRLQSYATLSEFVAKGQIRSLGVSNFGVRHIEELCASDEGKRVKPVVNQIECHPFFAQTELRKVCERNGIVVQAYCPLARGQYFDDPTLKDVAKRNGKTEAQVMLRWLLQHGIVPLPKSSNEKRQMENAESLAFTLSPDDMRTLDGLDRGDQGYVEVQAMSQNTA